MPQWGSGGIVMWAPPEVLMGWCPGWWWCTTGNDLHDVIAVVGCVVVFVLLLEHVDHDVDHGVDHHTSTQQYIPIVVDGICKGGVGVKGA